MKKWFVVVNVVSCLSVGLNLQAKPVENPQSAIYHHSLKAELRHFNINPKTLFEQTLAGLSFIGLENWDQAEAFLNRCRYEWQETAFKPTGLRLWLALFAIQYDRQTGQNKYKAFSERLLKEYCASEDYFGLPVIEQGDAEFGINWNQILSTEDALLGIKVLGLALETTDSDEAKSVYQAKLNTLLKSKEMLAAFPENSFLIISFSREFEPASLNKCKVYRINSQTYLLTEPSSIQAGRADHYSELPALYWESMIGLPEHIRVKKYEAFRRALTSVNQFNILKKENPFKVYADSYTALTERDNWYLPEKAKNSSLNSRLEKVCFTFFQQAWNPFSFDKMKVKSMAPEVEQAKMYLASGDTEKAEQVAHAVVSRSEETDSDKKAASWFILGKVYYDKAQKANKDFKFNLGDHFQTKSNEAFQKVASHYSSATISGSNGQGKSFLQIIKEIYH